MLLALQLCELLGSRNLIGATNLIDTACQAATRYFCSLLTDSGFGKGSCPISCYTSSEPHSLCRTECLLKHRWPRNNSADQGKLCIHWGKSLWLSLWCFFPNLQTFLLQGAPSVVNCRKHGKYFWSARRLQGNEIREKDRFVATSLHFPKRKKSHTKLEKNKMKQDKRFKGKVK